MIQGLRNIKKVSPIRFLAPIPDNSDLADKYTKKGELQVFQ